MSLGDESTRICEEHPTVKPAVPPQAAAVCAATPEGEETADPTSLDSKEEEEAAGGGGGGGMQRPAPHSTLYYENKDLSQHIVSPIGPSAFTLQPMGEYNVLPYQCIDEAWLGHRAVVIHNVMSKEECAGLCAHMDSLGMKHCGFRPSYRDNLRAISTSEEIAKELCLRLMPSLSHMKEDVKHVCHANRSEYIANGFGMLGTWRIDRLNPCFRLCKYEPLGHFAPHYDGDYIVDALTDRSLKTFMIYLNDDYENGETNFLTDPEKIYVDPVTLRECSNPANVRGRFKAKSGDLLVFDHKIFHEGAQVKSGCKYIMRTDVMYRKLPLAEGDDAEDPLLLRAVALYYDACRMEEEKVDLTAAAEKYSKAFKLWPSLEQFT